MSELGAHPAADTFPMMSDERYAELRDDIAQHGQRELITLCEGQILDGRNRYKACVELGIAPLTRVWDGNPWDFAWSLNGSRRDMNDVQRYLCWKVVKERSAEWDRRMAAARRDANRKRSEAAQAQPRTDDGLFLEKAERVVVTKELLPDKNKTRAAKAEDAQVHPATVARADALQALRPDLAEQVRLGAVRPAEAFRQAKREQVASRVAALPDDKYTVIYADPPWKYNDSRAGLADNYQTAAVAHTAAESHYPTMSVSELSALGVRDLAADDAVLFCWATFPLLPDCLAVVKAWGFTYKTAFVWDKQRANMGHYHTASAELLLVATKGSCVPQVDAREPQVVSVSRGRHSEKPEDFRAMVDRMYPHGPRIELFARRKAPGPWRVWGNESGGENAA